MQTRLHIIATPALLLTLGISSSLMAQSSASRVSNTTLVYKGRAVIGTADGASSQDDFVARRSAKHEFAHNFGKAVTSSGRGRANLKPLALPAPTTEAVISPDPGFFNFAGLTHRDQRLAGTGAYTNTQFSLEPPDQGLAVGNGFVLEAINTALAVYDTTGTLLQGPTPLNQFFGLTPEVVRSHPPVFGAFSSDPRCYFDRQTQRWFITLLELDQDPSSGNFTGPSHLMIAVSQTNDPTLSWNIFSMDVTNDGDDPTLCPCFGDQPLLGADANGFYVSTNAFPTLAPGFDGPQIYAMSKQELAAGVTPTVVHLNGLSVPGGFAFSIQPATSPSVGGNGDSENGVEYFVSTFDITAALENHLTVWALTNTGSLSDPIPNIHLTNRVINSEAYGVPPDAPQKTGPTPLGTSVGEPEELLSTGDHRMQQVVFANGRLWSGVSTIVQDDPSAPAHAGIAFFVVKPSVEGHQLHAIVDTQGYLVVKGNDVFYPAIGVTEDGKATMTFTLSGPDFFPSAAYSPVHLGRGAGDVRIAAAGAAPDDGFTGYAAFGGAGSGRWGDYSAAVADGEGAVWFATEFIPNAPRTLLANWGTLIGKVVAGH